MTDNVKTVLVTIMSSAIIIGGAFALAGYGARSGATSADIDSEAITMADPADAGIVAVAPATSEPAAPAAPADPDFEAYVADAAIESDTSDTKETTLTDVSAEKFVVEDASIDRLAYVNTITEAEVESLKDFLKAQPDIDGDIVKEFFKEFSSKFKVYQDDEGNYLVAANIESWQQTDLVRPNKAIEAGLNKAGQPIDDALAFPYTLTGDQVAKILKLKAGQKADFSESEIETLKIEMFQYLLGCPTGLEAYIRLLNEQKIADKFYLNEYWHAGQEFLDKCDKARKDGKGMNIWFTKMVSKDGKTEMHFTTEEYHKYVIALFNLLWPRKAEVAVYTAKANDHYHLINCDFNSMRKATPADYSETLASLIFPFYTKDGKIAFRFGSNIRDKRPEILNYTAQKKTAKKTVTPTPTPVITWTQNPILPTVPTPTVPTPGTPGDPPGPTPTPTPGPTPEPTPTPEIKKPNEGTKAPVGGGQNDDPGPGEKKDDQGNGNGEYKPGTSPNPGNTDEHPSGPPSDNTDNGTPPKTDPIPVQPPTTEEKPGNNNGQMPSAPPVDD